MSEGRHCEIIGVCVCVCGGEFCLPGTCVSMGVGRWMEKTRRELPSVKSRLVERTQDRRLGRSKAKQWVFWKPREGCISRGEGLDGSAAARSSTGRPENWPLVW